MSNLRFIFTLMDRQTLQYNVNQINKLSEEDFALLMSCANKQQLKKGDVLLKEGEICVAFYLVDTGHLRTYYNKDGIAFNLNFSFEGDFTTNLKSYRNREASELTIEAGEDSEILVFNLRSITAEFTEHPQISRFVRRLAISLLLTSEEYSNLFKISTPTERYRYVEKHNPKLLQRISLSQMASYLGVTRETLSRIRAKKT